MRLIDADALILAIRHDADQTTDSNWGYGLKHDVVIVRNQPTVDAVPVVRCKDCKHCEYPNAEREWCKKGHLHGNAETWFCADGERRNNNA